MTMIYETDAKVRTETRCGGLFSITFIESNEIVQKLCINNLIKVVIKMYPNANILCHHKCNIIMQKNVKLMKLCRNRFVAFCQSLQKI